MNEKFQWKAKRERKAFIALADGAVFHGYAFGEKKDTVGEAVFNTGMAGYKQILTDPSYAGQFVRIPSGFLERHCRELPRLGFQGTERRIAS